MKFTYNSLSRFQSELQLISGIPGDVFSKFYVDTFLIVKAKMEELNEKNNKIPGVVEYLDYLNTEVAKRKKMKGNNKQWSQIKNEVVASLYGTDLESAMEEAKEKAYTEEFDLELPTLSYKDLPQNFTGSQRLVIHELIK